jgi:hypothetical protein
MEARKSGGVTEKDRLVVISAAVAALITRPSGAGEEVVARSLRDAPFDSINWLAFTLAISSRAGRFELAGGGTLFQIKLEVCPWACKWKCGG